METSNTPTIEITFSELRDRLSSNDPPLLLDVREASELVSGTIPGAIHVPRGELADRVKMVVDHPARRIVAYCASGVRSLFAAEALQHLGYAHAVSLSGGIHRWRAEGLPLQAIASALSPQQLRRYNRHLVLPEVGEAGQQKLCEARVLLVGAGGIGSPAAIYLAAAGVENITIVDDDRVDESNLQRQILHTTARVGQHKTDSARASLHALNPHVQVKTVSERLTPNNIEDVFYGHQIVIDGSDNFATRYLVNDACLRLGLPDVQGSVYRFEGQVAVFWPPHGPCYRCLFPEPPPAGVAPPCAEAGVLGVLPGVVGSLAAAEAIKLILEVGEPLVGRMLRYDALAGQTRTLALTRDPGCAGCSKGLPPLRYHGSESTARGSACCPRHPAR